MQAKITAHVCSNRKLWSESWVKDTKTNETMEDGSIPSTVEEYMQAIKRPRRWMDGLLLASAAVAQHINVVVFQFKQGSWVKIAVLRSGPEWKKAAVIPLVLYRGHYMTLRLQKARWPLEWAMDLEEETACSQSLDAPIDILRAGMFSTPKKRTSKGSRIGSSCKKNNAEEDWLRTCSSCPTATPALPRSTATLPRPHCHTATPPLPRPAATLPRPTATHRLPGMGKSTQVRRGLYTHYKDLIKGGMTIPKKTWLLTMAHVVDVKGK